MEKIRVGDAYQVRQGEHAEPEELLRYTVTGPDSCSDTESASSEASLGAWDWDAWDADDEVYLDSLVKSDAGSYGLAAEQPVHGGRKGAPAQPAAAGGAPDPAKVYLFLIFDRNRRCAGN